MEIITGRTLEDRVVSTMKIMGVDVIHNYDMLESGFRTKNAGGSKKDRKQRNLLAAIHRTEENVETSKNRWAQKWYSEKKLGAQDRLQKLTEQEKQQSIELGRQVEQQNDPTQQHEARCTTVQNIRNTRGSTPKKEGGGAPTCDMAHKIEKHAATENEQRRPSATPKISQRPTDELSTDDTIHG